MAENQRTPHIFNVAPSDLTSVSQAKVFFGHQSVGMNVLDGVRMVYAAHNMIAPLIERGVTMPSGGAGVIEHEFIGENKKPLLKIQDFDAKLRAAGLGNSVDVAMMKFCFLDVEKGTNVEELFAAYRATMADLQRDFPNLTIVHATVSLTTEQGFMSKLKSWVTGSDKSSEADNAAREQLNALIRKEYAGKHLFDLAAAESTLPDGTRAGGTYEGMPYYQLYDGYAANYGHLNDAGAQSAATAWLSVVAQAAAK
ncbi:MAG: hypothetical protein L0K86_00200 [Actinomycetia bacterium]|nr:hypothetical protein [Actinomycetes bacterium]